MTVVYVGAALVVGCVFWLGRVSMRAQTRETIIRAHMDGSREGHDRAKANALRQWGASVTRDELCRKIHDQAARLVLDDTRALETEVAKAAITAFRNAIPNAMLKVMFEEKLAGGDRQGETT